MIPTLLIVLPLALPQNAPPPLVQDAHVEQALAEAGQNRAELERVITHFEKGGDGQKLTAARFLIANMPGHGYIVTELRDEEGRAIPFDPLGCSNYQQALEALDALEREHGELEFDRTVMVKDLEVMEADYLIQHIDRAFQIWRATPAKRRVGLEAFLNHVLPYRGSQEPIGAWILPLHERYSELCTELGSDPEQLRSKINHDVHQRVRFDERFYLHPTDQGYSEMLTSGMGRCEDITNMMNYACRSMAIATAADYTPAWAHRDNNHAWNVLLDRDGIGSAASNAHAAKVYRKTFALQRDNLAFLLPEGREAPNRFLASKFYVDVTEQYAPTTDVHVTLEPQVADGESFAYICVFNGGEWIAIDWAPISEGNRVRFDRMGRNIVYLPAVHRDGEIVPAASPLLVLKDGSVRLLPGRAEPTGVIITSVRPRQTSPDTGVTTAVSYLEPGTRYELQEWTLGGWERLEELVAGKEALHFDGLARDGLYWMVAEGSRRLERVFTIEGERQRWW